MAAVILDPNSGKALSAKHQRIAEILNDFDARLELAWIPPENRGAFDKNEFAIFANEDGGRYMVTSFPEDLVDERLVAAMFRASGRAGNQLDLLEADEKARRVVKLKDQMEEHEAKLEFAQALIKTKKSTYRHNGKTYRTA